MQSKYKKEFFKRYVSTHIKGRKGDPTLDEFRVRSVMYQKQMGNYLPENKKANIIDVGCGNGSVVWWLIQAGYYNAEGIDISEEQIESAIKIGVPNVKWADLTSYLKERDNFYDVVILRDVLEHFAKDEIITILEICRDSLKNNGKMILQVPNAESPFFGRLRYGDFTHEIAFCYSSLNQILNMIGMKHIECHPSGPVYTGIKSLMRIFVWKILEMFYKFLLYSELGAAYGKRIVTQSVIAVAEKIQSDF